MKSALDWARDGHNWPHRAASQFVEAGSLCWHVQRMGSGPELLLLHGTGASCHSWRGAMAFLAEHFTLTVPDLPGHAFTGGKLRGGPSLGNVTTGLAALMDKLGVSPAVIAAHSAGVAIALEYARLNAPDTPIIGFAPAITPFPGLAAKLFPALAKMLFVNPLVPRIFSATASIPEETNRFLKRSTGSQIAPDDLACYEALFGSHKHCEGALAMMANWDLEALSANLSNVTNPVLIVHGRRDKAVPTGAVEGAVSRLPDARLKLLPDFGHLLHEEAPELAARYICDFAHSQDVPAEE